MKTSKTDQFHGMNRLIDGIHQELAKSEIVRLNGKKYRANELAKELKEHADKLEAVSQARALLEKALEEARKDAPKAARLVSAFKRAVRLMFADDPVAIASFGLVPHKQPRVRTVDEKIAAAAKAKATRVARHTMGPRQRAKIKGVVPAATPAPGEGERPEVLPALPPAVDLVLSNVWPSDL